MSSQVNDILRQIEGLSESDRLLLEQRLQDLAEAEWQREAESVRAVARYSGVDQRTIDNAVEELRYGS